MLFNPVPLNYVYKCFEAIMALDGLIILAGIAGLVIKRNLYPYLLVTLAAAMDLTAVSLHFFPNNLDLGAVQFFDFFFGILPYCLAWCIAVSALTVPTTRYIRIKGKVDTAEGSDESKEDDGDDDKSSKKVAWWHRFGYGVYMAYIWTWVIVFDSLRCYFGKEYYITVFLYWAYPLAFLLQLWVWRRHARYSKPRSFWIVLGVFVSMLLVTLSFLTYERVGHVPEHVYEAMDIVELVFISFFISVSFLLVAVLGTLLSGDPSLTDSLAQNQDNEELESNDGILDAISNIISTISDCCDGDGDGDTSW